MCSKKTDAMNNSDITRTGTGPLQNRKSCYKELPQSSFYEEKIAAYTLTPGESSV